MKPTPRREKMHKTIKSVRTHEATMAALGVASGWHRVNSDPAYAEAFGLKTKEKDKK